MSTSDGLASAHPEMARSIRADLHTLETETATDTPAFETAARRLAAVVRTRRFGRRRHVGFNDVLRSFLAGILGVTSCLLTYRGLKRTKRSLQIVNLFAQGSVHLLFHRTGGIFCYRSAAAHRSALADWTS